MHEAILKDICYAHARVTEETGITLEDVEAVHVAWFRGTTEQLFRELELAGVLELAAARLRSGQGWDEGATGDVLRDVSHVYSEHVKKGARVGADVGEILSLPNNGQTLR